MITLKIKKPTPVNETPKDSPNLLQTRVVETDSQKEFPEVNGIGLGLYPYDIATDPIDGLIGYVGSPGPTPSSDATIMPSPTNNKKRPPPVAQTDLEANINHLIDDEGKYHQLVVHQLEKVCVIMNHTRTLIKRMNHIVPLVKPKI